MWMFCVGPPCFPSTGCYLVPCSHLPHLSTLPTLITLVTSPTLSILATLPTWKEVTDCPGETGTDRDWATDPLPPAMRPVLSLLRGDCARMKKGYRVTVGLMEGHFRVTGLHGNETGPLTAARRLWVRLIQGYKVNEGLLWGYMETRVTLAF